MVALSSTEVAKKPGSMHATSMPKSCPSDAIESLSEHSACFVAEYDEVYGVPYMRPAIDDDDVDDRAGPSLAHRWERRPGAAQGTSRGWWR